MINVRVLAIAAAIVSIATTAFAGTSWTESKDHLLPKGKDFTIDLPELGAGWLDDAPVRCQVFLPEFYKEHQWYPLVAWFPDSKGDDKLLIPKRITDRKTYIIVSMPYQPEVGGKGGSKTDWRFHKAVLDAVEKRIKNIIPQKKLAFGYGIGADQIMTHLSKNGKEFTDYFSGIAVGGGGKPSGGLNHLSGKRALAFVGDQEPAKADLLEFKTNAEAAGAEVVWVEFFDTGHDIPMDYYKTLQDWFNGFHRAGLGEAVNKMDEAMAKGDYPGALPHIQFIVMMNLVRSFELSRAKAHLNKINDIGREELDKILAGKYTAQDLKEYIKKWNVCGDTLRARTYCDALGFGEIEAAVNKKPVDVNELRRLAEEWDGWNCVIKAKDALNAAGIEELKTLMAMNPIPPNKVVQFLKDWKGYEAREQALYVCAHIGFEEFNKIKEQRASTAMPRKLREFITDWDGMIAAKEAVAFMEDTAKKELDEVKAAKNKASQKTGYKKVMERWPGTEAGDESERLFKELEAVKKK